MAIKELVKSGLNRLGLNITRVPPPHFLSHHVKNFIRKNDINLILDVGAYHGDYCRMLRKEVGYRGLIISFEPCAISFQFLSSQMADDSNWRGYQYGLSDTDTTAVLNTYRASDFNSLLSLGEEAKNIYKVEAHNASTEFIQLFKIDTIWDDLTKGVRSPRALLKIDTQGHDTSVALGAADHIEFIQGIQTELPAIELYNKMISMSDALKIYRQLGYVPIGFFPVNTPEGDGISPEFDVLMKQHQGLKRL